jgi:hypothetical protein
MVPRITAKSLRLPITTPTKTLSSGSASMPDYTVSSWTPRL